MHCSSPEDLVAVLYFYLVVSGGDWRARPNQCGWRWIGKFCVLDVIWPGDSAGPNYFVALEGLGFGSRISVGAFGQLGGS